MEETAVNHKPVLSKCTTMIATAKEGKAILGHAKLDPDAGTRFQQKRLEEVLAEKKKIERDDTMTATAKEGKLFLKRSRKKKSAEQQTIAESMLFTGASTVNVAEPRSLRNKKDVTYALAAKRRKR